jgi:hypothetical protein
VTLTDVCSVVLSRLGHALGAVKEFSFAGKGAGTVRKTPSVSEDEMAELVGMGWNTGKLHQSELIKMLAGAKVRQLQKRFADVFIAWHDFCPNDLPEGAEAEAAENSRLSSSSRSH